MSCIQAFSKGLYKKPQNKSSPNNKMKCQRPNSTKEDNYNITKLNKLYRKSFHNQRYLCKNNRTNKKYHKSRTSTYNHYNKSIKSMAKSRYNHFKSNQNIINKISREGGRSMILQSNSNIIKMVILIINNVHLKLLLRSTLQAHVLFGEATEQARPFPLLSPPTQPILRAERRTRT